MFIYCDTLKKIKESQLQLPQNNHRFRNLIFKISILKIYKTLIKEIEKNTKSGKKYPIPALDIRQDCFSSG